MMTDFNNWCKELGVATLCDYNERGVKDWVERLENANHIEWINYQKAYSKVNGHILGLERAIVDERNR
jgi:hypothetical protein